MILVDSSVWIDFFRGKDTPQTAMLEALLSHRELLIGDLIFAEVLQGVRGNKEFKQVKTAFDSLTQIQIGGYDIAIQSARNYRLLRDKGITIRKTIDTLIATRCIEDGIALLHADRGFTHFAEHLGLQEVFLES